MWKCPNVALNDDELGQPYEKVRRKPKKKKKNDSVDF